MARQVTMASALRHAAWLLPLLLVLVHPAAATLEHPALDVKTIVNNVPWWPESNLQFEEAVGVVSRDVLFMTGMLAATEIAYSVKRFNTSQLVLEVADVHDIAKAANTSLSGLLDCVADVPVGSAGAAKAALQKALGGARSSPCITVLETLGEDPDDYPGNVYNSSISCFASTAKAPAKIRRQKLTGEGVDVAVVDQGNGMAWMAAEAAGAAAAAAPGFWAEVQKALGRAHGAYALADVVDCTVFVPPGTTDGVVASVQHAVANHTGGGGQYAAAQLTAVRVGVGGAKTKLRCTAIANGRAEKRRHLAPSGSTSVVVAGGFAYVSGVGSAQPNATDAFAEMGRALKAAGSRLNLVLNCMFFVSKQSIIDGKNNTGGSFFEGFHDTFNRDAENKTAVGFPPPSRNAFVGQCTTAPHCPVLSKCVAAMPASSVGGVKTDDAALSNGSTVTAGTVELPVAVAVAVGAVSHSANASVAVLDNPIEPIKWVNSGPVPRGYRKEQKRAFCGEYPPSGPLTQHSLHAAALMCERSFGCACITRTSAGYELRSGWKLSASTSGESSWLRASGPVRIMGRRRVPSAEEQKEAMEVFLFLMGFMMGAQMLIFWWKKTYPKSFMQVTLLGLWVMPLVFSTQLHFWRMITAWAVFTAGTGYMVYLSTRPQLDMKTPRAVYSWFFLVYRISYGSAVAGYGLVMLDFFGFSDIVADRVHHVSQWGLMLLFYGLYYGVLGRDFAEVVQDKLSSKMGYLTEKGGKMATRALPPNTCAICGEELPDLLELAREDSSLTAEQREAKEQVVTLNCRHQYHEWCIRGWVMVGKKDSCPHCFEKVDLRKTFNSPWVTQGIMYANLLDMVRYLVVWNPLIIMATQLSLRWMGFEHAKPADNAAHNLGASAGH